MFSFYTPIEANKILPEIQSKFKKVLEQRDKITKINAELNEVISQDKSFEIFFRKKMELNQTINSIYKNIEDIESFGILIKSFDEGLLDFPSKRYDEEVWLCWKIGEDKIKFWHRKNEGFMGRKPLSIKGTYNEENLEDLR